jgi:chemotaxis protein CheZ
MSVRRKRFRIEEINFGSTPMPAEVEDGEGIPMHREIMSELRAIRDQMASPHRSSVAGESVSDAVTREVADAKALLETYRAQIEQCEKLKVELDLIHDAINRTKREIAVLHGKSFDGDEMSKVTGELGAVVGGTEEATQQILEAAEAIDQASSAMTKVNSPDQQKLLSEEIQERVISIFEACNHINVMMEIWGGVDAIRAHAPPIIDDREGDAKLLNGPKLDGDVGHASQNDIDALFD